MSHFAVLDTETTWSDEVMSLCFVIADENGFVLNPILLSLVYGERKEISCLQEDLSKKCTRHLMN